MGDVSTTLEFLADLPLYSKEKPFHVIPPASTAATYTMKQLGNIVLDNGKVTVHDIREQEEEFKLERNGFEIVDNCARNLSFNSTECLRRYGAEIDEFLRKETGADYVSCFSVKVSLPRHLSNYSSTTS